MGKTAVEIKKDALALIRQTDASYRQLSKALCGKENATLEELLQGASQVKAELAAVKRERDAAVADLGLCGLCKVCKHMETKCNDCRRCKLRIAFCDKFEWRGVCPDTEVQEDVAE